MRPPVRTLGVGEKVSRLTLEQERVGVSVCKSEGAVLLEQGGTLLPVLKSWKVENWSEILVTFLQSPVHLVYSVRSLQVP